MKRLLTVLFFLLLPSIAFAQSQAGISPCTPTAQPADLSFSSSSANVQLSTCGETLIIFNNSTSDARFVLGSSSSTAATLSNQLLPQKTFIVLNVGTSGLYFAAISSGSGTISFIQGTASN